MYIRYESKDKRRDLHWCCWSGANRKSTFIKRFMNLMEVLPNIEDENDRNRANDELPQSSSGKTIMTTEPKFVPNEAVSIKDGRRIELNVRLIDCMGYMVEGATGHMEGEERGL